jgi:hypothetical protein
VTVFTQGQTFEMQWALMQRASNDENYSFASSDLTARAFM